MSDQFSEICVSFEDSCESDHAGLSLAWCPATALPPLSCKTLPGFAIDDNLKDSWIRSFAAIPSPVITTTSSLQIASDALIADIKQVSSTLFTPRRPPDPQGVRWWNHECSAAYTILQHSPKADKAVARSAYYATVNDAKRAWSDDFLQNTTAEKVWAATRWHHGRRISTIPPLRTPAGLSHDRQLMGDALAARFFPISSSPVAPSQPDDPAPHPVRNFDPIIPEEISTALLSCSNSSAPGLSGINYKLVKWAFMASPQRFVDIYNYSIRLGLHPWRVAKIVPVLKPNKVDYSLPKSFRPVSLLECCGKLLEKIIARRVNDDINRFQLLSPHQFGSRDSHCAIDTVLATTHTIESCVKTGHIAALLLLDIQGFFDHLHVDRTAHIFHLLGFADSLCDWVRSFMSDRIAHLTFNGTTSDALPLPLGTPQGSPLSPILSAIYTSPLLHLTETWNLKSFNMYVDDGSIISTGKTFCTAAAGAARGYEVVTEWLLCNGLKTDPDKCEFIFFQPRRSKNLSSSFDCLDLRDPVHGNLHV